MVSTEIACRGSYRKVCPHAGAGHLACFHELEAARVWAALQRLMQKNHVQRREPAAA
jgi:heptosyltransferase I